MKHFIKNLVLFPVKLAWDAFLILAVIILQIIWLALVFSILGIPMALFFILGSIVGGSDLMVCTLCPLLLLMLLKNPWPGFSKGRF